ncbi:MAG: LLM class flavin-dependent oxidoreductase [Gammaproteobacteria bacterium]|nr:MAG: LLM class flavin-dependent oxidoreductase [Gammaproteobacteria bacterium]
MAHDLRFQVVVLPNTDWNALLVRFLAVEELGFDLVGMADHFVDWTNPPSPWFDLWSQAAAVAANTSRIRLSTCVAQIPLRNPAMLARQALSVDHISNGRLELGLGLGLPIDPSYAMMGIPNWSNKERVARFGEYVEIVDGLLTNEVTSYKGEFYQIDAAVMNPRPVQKPRPPIMIAAMGPVMLKKAARYADIWNSLSFAEDFDDQMNETRHRIEQVDEHCAAIGRDPGTLRRSYLMFDAKARPSGGLIKYYESESMFTDMVERVMELGVTDIGMYYPMREEQLPMFEKIATEVIPKLRRQ